MPRSPKVSEKNTKGEIFDAYRQLLTEASVGEEMTSPEDKAAVATASKETVEKITKDLSSLKLSLNQTIADLMDRLTQEAERLATIQKAIAVAQRELEETQAVKVRLGMLKRMIDLQKEKEESFEKEMSAKRLAWEEEQRTHDESVRRERSRNEEEYAYQQKLLKARDDDKKEERARDLKELDELRKKVTQFPSELEKSVKETVAAAVTKEKDAAAITAKLAAQEAESKLALAIAKTGSLEDLVKSQTAEIARLNRELSQATSQVKDIAIAVAEGQRKETQAPTPKTPS